MVRAEARFWQAGERAQKKGPADCAGGAKRGPCEKGDASALMGVVIAPVVWPRSVAPRMPDPAYGSRSQQSGSDTTAPPVAPNNLLIIWCAGRRKPVCESHRVGSAGPAGKKHRGSRDTQGISERSGDSHSFLSLVRSGRTFGRRGQTRIGPIFRPCAARPSNTVQLSVTSRKKGPAPFARGASSWHAGSWGGSRTPFHL